MRKFFYNKSAFPFFTLSTDLARNFSRQGAKARNFILLLFVCVSLFSNCQNETTQPAGSIPTREITDDLGRTVKIPVKVERAVSLAPNLTEIVFAVGAGEKLVGVTSFCNYPEEAKNVTKIGDTINPNLEAIIARKPQIVFVSTASQIENFTRRTEENGIAVFVTNAESLDGVLRNIQQIADVLGTEKKAEKLVSELKARIFAVENNVTDKPKTKVFVQISKEPLFTVGKDSFLTEIIERAGGVSVTKAVETAYPKISKETALALNPEAIILSESPDNLEPNDIFKESPAVKSGKVFKINADLISRPAPRIVDALEQIARDLQQ